MNIIPSDIFRLVRNIISFLVNFLVSPYFRTLIIDFLTGLHVWARIVSLPVGFCFWAAAVGAVVGCCSLPSQPAAHAFKRQFGAFHISEFRKLLHAIAFSVPSSSPRAFGGIMLG